MRRGRIVASLAAAVCNACAAVPASPPVTTAAYAPNRGDYRAFASDRSDLLEPNYLPFMLHEQPGATGRTTRFFCRWPAEAMPLRFRVAPFEIPDALQYEFRRREASEYVKAVVEALAVWEHALEGHVRFVAADDATSADVTLRLRPERAPEPDADRTVLGVAHLARACEVKGRADGAGPLDVSFAVPLLEIFLADGHGLLAPDQVHRIALHEVGHVLGMRGHSPIPADLMYAVARDRLQVAEGLSPQDVNSFLSLYGMKNGTVFPATNRDAAGSAIQPDDAPSLAIAPHVDARHGFRLRMPEGWTRFSTPHGVVAVDGVTWDYAASFQVAIQRYATLEEFLERYGPYYLARGAVSAPARLSVDGRRALRSRILLRDAPRFEEVTLVEVGDGRLLVITADAPADQIEAYRLTFDAVIGSLRIRDAPEDAWPGRR